MPHVHPRRRKPVHAGPSPGASDLAQGCASEEWQNGGDAGRRASARAHPAHGSLEIPPTTPEEAWALTRPGLFLLDFSFSHQRAKVREDKEILSRRCQARKSIRHRILPK